MHCSSCGAEHLAGARFCAGCGIAVAAPRPSLAERAKALLVPPVVAAVAGIVLLAGLGLAVVRDQSRSDDLRRTRAELSATRGDLDGTRTKLGDTEKKLADEAAKLARATTELTGVRGSLNATSKERDSMKTCFSGFIEAINSGSPAQAEAIYRRVKPECDKIDHLLD